MANADDTGPVLFAYDGSDQARASIQEAGRQLGPGRYAIVLSVWQPLATLPFSSVARVPPDLEAGFEREAFQVAREGAELAQSLGFDATPLTEHGEPVWRAIVDAADTHEAGILVLGSHGRTGIGLVLMGSVAAAVARHTDRPVMIVHRPPAPRAD
jgi:nucleotide-binding universal stress UspA family protein